MEYLVTTPCGQLRGTAGRVPGTAAYKGIRYATAGRWEYPVPVTGWEGIYDATAYGNCSYQPRSFYDEELNEKKYFYYNEFRKGESYTYSDDCLFLNIFTPAQAKPDAKLPVLIYIHGGGFTGGCGHEKHFDGPVWPAKGVIGVTLNYRLGLMGFLCHPQLEQEAGHTGNYGLYDQLCAITWVRDNIAAFGGDPENITVMGQSAGGMSVQMLCQSPLARGTFRKAVLSSGCGMANMMRSTVESSGAFWQGLMEQIGCSSIQELRTMPAQELFSHWQSLKGKIKGGNSAVFPVLDGHFICENAQPMDIPYMAGSTSHDMAPPVLMKLTQNWIYQRTQPSYQWFFNRMLPGDDHGAWHSSDLWYWFGTLDNCWRPMEQKDRQLSELMTDYLVRFCETGDPNGGTAPRWLPAAKDQKQLMLLGEREPGMGKPSLLKLICTMFTNKAVGE